MSNPQVFDKNTLERFSKQVQKIRKSLVRSRKEFWVKNKENFEKNVEKLIKLAHLPPDWKVYFLASRFLNIEEIMPYAYDSWSIVLLICATKKQGCELLVFYNQARSGFLSFPALIPLVTHEIIHTYQAARSPKEYSASAFDDELSSQLETESEEYVHELPLILRQEAVLESVLYCYDKKGWKSAQKMIDFLYKERVNLYSGGYLPWLIEKDYRAFLEAKKKKDISIFLNYYIKML